MTEQQRTTSATLNRIIIELVEEIAGDSPTPVRMALVRARDNVVRALAETGDERAIDTMREIDELAAM